MILLLLPLVLVLLYYYTTRNHDYWEKRNVKYEKPVPVFGTLYSNVTAKKSITEIAVELYNKYPNEPVVGLFRGTTPELVVRDLDIVRRILNLDFAYFYPRGLGRDPKIEPVFLNLFHVDGDKWKLLRQRLTSTFTTAKLKNMFPLVVQCAEKLQHVGEDIVNKGGDCDVRELMARFTTEFIGACGFGIQMDTINDEHSLFRDLGRKIFKRSWKNYIIVALCDLFPDFTGIFQRILHETFLMDSLTEIVQNIRKQRNNKPIGRNDFIDLLLELEGKGKITGESVEKRSADGKPEHVEMEMDLTCMVAQVFVFFAAGFETSSSATSFMLHQLAFHPNEQRKIQEDIDQVLAKYNNKLCYDSIAEMTPLSNGFKEAMRMFPSLGTLHRVCARKCTIPELGITLDPGVKIIVPVQAIQNDKKYFDNPTEFQPDRFNDPNVEKHKFAYLPFGEGPRQCIEIVQNIRKQRNNKPIGRNDFIDLLLELEGKGKITGESVEKRSADGKPEHVEMEMDLTCMVAQVFVFFAAGFETSSSATSFMLHQLAFHPNEQRKIQEDIDQVLAKYNNKLCYDSIAEMTPLSNGFKEAMRMFPSLGTLHRVCARKCTIPELGITLDPGVKIIVPVQAIQNDKKYFDNPTEFQPDRFNDPNVEKHKFAYLPFGEGPRQCIGARLGEMQSLAGLAAILHKFSVEPAASTKRKLEVNHGSNTVQSIEGGLPLKLRLRSKDNHVAA